MFCVILARTSGYLSQYFEIIADSLDKLLAAALHEPNLEGDFAGQAVVEWPALAGPVIGPKNWLLKTFVVCERKRKVKRLKLWFTFRVDKDKARCRHNHNTLTFQFAHALYLKFKVDSNSLETKVFALNSQGLEVCTKGRIQRH